MERLLVKNIGLLQTPVGSYAHKGKEQGKNRKLKDAVMVSEDGVITKICSRSEFNEKENAFDFVIDVEGNLVTPGLIDAHTHLVFGGYRQHEIPLKLKGADYLEILRQGGGILDTVRKTREASFKELYDKSESFLDEMLALGVTTVEAKSGYGLDRDTEIKTLEVIKALSENHPMTIVSSYMGAHAIPEEYKGKADLYIDKVCKSVMEEVKEKGLADFVDVFCEDSVFNVEQTERYLNMAKEMGFKLRIHADEIEEIGGSVLAGKVKAKTAEHLIAIGEKGIEALRDGGVTAMLLPSTSFYLNKNFAPARRMIEEGVPVAIATDFNPGSSPSLNLQFSVNLGYLKYRMTPEEILTAVTINPAAALNLEKRAGTLEEGKDMDLAVWNAQDMEMLCYRFGSNLCAGTVKKGRLV